MKFIADFHIHSHYSRATSKELIPEYLEYWAKLKGITIVGTGDFTHPGWTKELKEKLIPAEQGLFKLKKEYRPEDLETPFLPDKEVRFLLTTEISNIYKKKERVRKVHNVIFAPDFETVEKIQQKLTAVNANITSDGRPILGLDSRDLLEMVLDANEKNFFVPAHIWTPWFSVLGSKSGFNSITECFDDLAHHIYAVETGLSTDPPMNWMCSFLDNYTLTANSDAHSPERLGRNSNRFDTELSYDAIIGAMKTGDPNHFFGSIDLFPQEGKYHYDGHRKCSICWDPVETLKHDSICSKCGKPVTVGVMNRVVQLSDREDLSQRPNRHPFQSIIPLKEMLGELAGVGPNSKKVDQTYIDLVKKGVSELELLMDIPIEEIKTIGGEELAEAICRMRNREIYIQEGFDGEYGIIKVFAEDERPALDLQNCLFKDLVKQERRVPPPRKMINFDLEEFRRLTEVKALEVDREDKKKTDKNKVTPGLNPQQQEAVEHFTGPALVIAGPGTGKTRVLTYRILHLIENKNINPGNILAVTFTNKAAAEISERLETLLKNKSIASKPQVTTFHALGYSILREQDRVGEDPVSSFSILDPEDKKRIIQRFPGIEKSRVSGIANAIEEAKQQLKNPTDFETENPELADIFKKYQDYLREQNIYDLADLLYVPVRLFEGCPDILDFYREKYQWILIDEYQDINYAQYKLIRSLMPDVDANLCAIGDPDQAIYGFRGADVRFIRRFQEDYPGAAVYRLKQSYRCSDSILKASGNVMQRVVSDDALLTGMEEGVKIKIVKNSTHKSEAEFVARTIEQMMGGLRFFSMDSSITEGHKEGEIDSLSDFVVLCRVKGQMEALEKAFMDHSIPYQIVGEEPFFKQEPICSIIDLLKFSRNPKNTILKDKLIEKEIVTPLELGALKNIVGGNSVKEMIVNLVNTYFSDIKEVDPDGQVEFNQKFLQGSRGRFFQKESPDFKRLLDLVGDYGNDLNGFLRFTALGTAVDTYRPDLEQVTLMTLHGAKGLEFKAVFIVGCEEGLLPYSLFKSQTSDPEEERRLLYVGMTRAKKFLFLSHAEKRFLLGREYKLGRSLFLNRIERELIELSQQEKKKAKEPIQRTLFDLK
ncbi:MAG: UvrD-helicase domain-containing protein [Candidatus Aminicenantes bacterium]|nr:MAG: UvrD-helicase domain-containing protein [Candidatus Aminicenantes bacterium]